MSLKLQVSIPGSDIGSRKPLFSWNSSSNVFAVVGSKGKAMILTRSGKQEHQFSMPNTTAIQWDRSSDNMAMLCENSEKLTLYNLRLKKAEAVETGMEYLTVASFSKNGVYVCVGSASGAFIVYNRNNLRKILVKETHTGEIMDAKWTYDQKVVTLSGDRTVAVSDLDGSKLQSYTLDNNPLQMVLLETAATNRQPAVCTVVVNCGTSVQLFNLITKEAVSAHFDEGFGSIVCISASSDQSFMVGFSKGIVGLALFKDGAVAITSHVKAFGGPVMQICFGPGSGLCAAASATAVKMFNKTADRLTESTESAVKLDDGLGSITDLQWSPDGQSIAVCTDAGNAMTYTLNVLNISACCGFLVFYFVSSRVVAVKNIDEGKVICTIPIDIEPTFMAAGMGILAVGTNNKVLYYEYYIPNSLPPSVEGANPAQRQAATEPYSRLLRTVEYPSVVRDLKVSYRFAGVLFDGKARLHAIRESEEENADVMLPQPGEAAIVSIGISEHLFVYATTNKVVLVSTDNLQTVAEYTCRTGLKRAFPNHSCTRVAYLDDKDVLFILNPITEVACEAEGYEPGHNAVLWDQGESTVFITHDKSKMITYVCSPYSRHGATCESFLDAVMENDEGNDPEQNRYTPLPPQQTPITLLKGVVFTQTASGSLDAVQLLTHTDTLSRMPNSNAFYNNCTLNRLKWSSQNITSPAEAEELARKAMHMLDIELAIRVYRQLSKPGLVQCLEKIKHIQEKNLLLGHVSMIMTFYNDAEKFFLHSSQPLCALEMRRDLMQWEPALSLAKNLDPQQLPIVSRDYAQQLEYGGEYVKALEMYRKGKREMPTGQSGTVLSAAKEEVENHNRSCQEGVARCLIRTGSIKEGVDIASASENAAFVTDCASLCEDNKKYEEAARLYEKTGDIEKAVSLYIEKAKNLKAAARLLPQIHSRNIIGLFAKAKEAEGSYKEAEEAFAQAEDWDNVVRLKVEKLNDLHGAYNIVRETRSAEAASMVAKMCQTRGENGTAVEFLVLAKSNSEAFELAKGSNTMSKYETALINQVQLKDGVAPLQSQNDFAQIATYYDGVGQPGQAALFYHIAGNYAMALQKYLEAGEPEDIEKAVEVVGKAGSDSLTNKLIDYLMGEADGEPKDPSYIFKLYMALGSYEKAAKTSVIIATKEQEMGNYKAAHKTLVDTCKILNEKGRRIPNDLKRSLMLLHSYILVKDLIKVMNDENTACRMLIRVSRNIQKFPKHITTIVTTTVFQCVKSGFAKSAFEFACVLIQNEKYRAELSEKNRKKIEGIVRKRGKDEMEDPPETTTPCPFCSAPVPETELDCGACKNTLPFCVVTGKHIVKDDFSYTPCCHFPVIHSALHTRAREESNCPMCNSIVDLNKVQKDLNPDLKVFQ